MSQKTIKKIVRFFAVVDGAFKKCSSLIAFLLFVVWIIWPMQIDFKAQIEKGPAEGVILDRVERYKFQEDFFALTEPIQKRARKLGDDYTPTIYYEDIKKIELWVSQQEAYDWELVNSIKSGLHSQMTGYGYGIHYWTTQRGEEMKLASLEYNEWRTENFPGEKRGLMSREEMSAWLVKALRWIFVFWLRSLLLIPVLYFNRMAREKGILKTILSGKAKFVFAIIAWPYYFFAYPGNWIREIVAEAELRRMGLAFRKLSLRERLAVKNAGSMSSKDFRQWRGDFRLAHRTDFQRRFGLALLFTLVVIILLPSLSRGSPQNVCRGPTVIISAVQEAADIDSGPGSVVLDQVPDALPGEFFIPDPPRLEEVFEIEIENKAQGAVKDIGHIPLSTGCALAA